MFALSVAIVLNGMAVSTYAQKGTEKERPRCTAATANVYFVDSGTVVTAMHPGSTGGFLTNAAFLATYLNFFMPPKGKQS